MSVWIVIETSSPKRRMASLYPMQTCPRSLPAKKLRSVSAESPYMVLSLRVKEVVMRHSSRASTRTIACLAMSFSVAIEISQLYHAPWIDSIRQTTLGGLILGSGFLWSDLACYALGVGLGVMIDIALSALKERQNGTSTEPCHAVHSSD